MSTEFWYSLDPIPDGSDESYNYTHYMMSAWKNLRSDYEYQVFDERSARAYLADNLPSVVLEAYDTLIPGSFKSDLFRMAVLLVEGGIYADNDLLPDSRGMNELLSKDDGNTFFVSIDTRPHCLLSGMIGSIPGHPAIALALSRAVSQILKRSTIVDIGTNFCDELPDVPIGTLLDRESLYLTGPCLLGTSVNLALGRPAFAGFEQGTLSASDDAPLPFTGSMRFFGVHFVDKPDAPSGRSMQRYIINENGESLPVTWSKLSKEVPRSNETHYGRIVNQVPTFHKNKLGVYMAPEDDEYTSRDKWYDFTVKLPSQLKGRSSSYSTRQLRNNKK